MLIVAGTLAGAVLGVLALSWVASLQQDGWALIPIAMLIGAVGGGIIGGTLAVVLT